MSDVRVIAGGAVVADTLRAFDAAVADPKALLIAIPVPERRRVVVYRKLITKMVREEYGLEEEVYVADGRVLLARSLGGRERR
ncbi:hypothetical protein [Pelagibacterium halotolerans]|uniref:hypothetical protein n=1 Tax=Pelagibacterium halotolerans TaxID=531813 RepID=UPI00384AD63D